MATVAKKKEDLIDLVLSWSLADIMNQDLYQDKVNRIPDTFLSANDYVNSFVNPLIEETHSDLRSTMMNLHPSATREILGVKKGKASEPPEKLLYTITLRTTANSDNKPRLYEPECGDLIAITDVIPKGVNDLNRPKGSYVVALVQGNYKGSTRIRVLSSKPIFFKKSDNLFAVYLTNLTTNIRIWNALHPGKRGNMKIINTVLRNNPSVSENCTLCSSRINRSKSREVIESFGLDDSQEDAVLSCIALTECHHQNSVKLIWGPPGTGKTKTVASLLFALLRKKCRTVTCAPTNVAVIGVAKRLMSSLSGTLEHDTYGLGDVVLFGNGKRMKIGEHEDLHDVFLDHRVSVLSDCLSGWTGMLDDMMCLLEDPEGQYLRYLGQRKAKKDDSDSDDAGDKGEEDEKGNEFPGQDRLCCVQDKEGLRKNENLKGTLEDSIWKKLIIQNIKENRKKKEVPAGERGKPNAAGKENEHSGASREGNTLWSFEEFFKKKFYRFLKQLIFCITGLYTHLPTSLLPSEVLINMISVLSVLQMLQTLLQNVESSQEGWPERALIEKEETGSTDHASLYAIRLECLKAMKLLCETFSVPDFSKYHGIRDFCLKNACLVFCTVSSSQKLHVKRMTPLELVIIDEAAQLKECESCIPLQLPGLRHAVFVGDEKQLPAMVKSKICDKAGFGRSLFERLATLGHSKHLLNVQYRMHPSISFFPNKAFYGGQIMDGPNVKERSHEKHFLKEKFFGSYSFINITHGEEEFDNNRSRKNVVEVSVVAEIVSKLCEESIHSKEKLRVGCISPYNAQVFAIQESLGNTYSTDAKDTFSVIVRSVDGFQGGEEDVIIISTVRRNKNGYIGFLDSHQRTNVALTRARYGLWILGNAPTLLNCKSVWQELVVNAKQRGCFYDAREDRNLSMAVSYALIDLGQLNSLFTMDCILFKAAKWKICFSPEFHESILKFQDREIRKQVVTLLVKLSKGWRQQRRDKTVRRVEGVCSLLLECCDVKGPIKLIWTVDIHRENSIDTQVIKILDVLRKSEIRKVANKIDILFGDYTWDQINRCLCKRMKRGSMLPMTWPVDSRDSDTYSSNDPSVELAIQLAAMNLREHPRSVTGRNNVSDQQMLSRTSWKLKQKS